MREFLLELGYDDADIMGESILEILAKQNGYVN